MSIRSVYYENKHVQSIYDRRGVNDPHLCFGPNCEATVSGNKSYCATCQAARDLHNVTGDGVTPGTTHIINNFQLSGQDSEYLFRADGMLVAVRHADSVKFGNDIPTMQSRNFMTAKMAAAWLRIVADADLVAEQEGRPLVGEPIVTEMGIARVHSGYLWNYGKYPNAAVIECRDLERDDTGKARLVLPGKLSEGVNFRM